MRYDLLDVETGNLYDRFSSEEAALSFIRSLIESNGVEIADTLMLGGRDDTGRKIPVRTGAALARRAQTATPDRSPLARRT